MAFQYETQQVKRQRVGEIKSKIGLLLRKSSLFDF